MKKLVFVALVLAFFSAPLLAKSTTISIPENVTVGTTHISAGTYKVEYEGPGPAVKVTLKGNGIAPISLDARLVAGGSNGEGVSLDTVNGVRVPVEIELGSNVLELGTQQSALK